MTEASFFVSCTTLQPPLQGFRPPVRPPTENLVAGKAMWSNGHGKMWGHRESILDRTLRQRMRARVTTAPPGRSQDHLVGRPPTKSGVKSFTSWWKSSTEVLKTCLMTSTRRQPDYHDPSNGAHKSTPCSTMEPSWPKPCHISFREMSLMDKWWVCYFDLYDILITNHYEITSAHRAFAATPCITTPIWLQPTFHIQDWKALKCQTLSVAVHVIVLVS